MRALVCFGLDAVSLSFGDGVGLVLLRPRVPRPRAYGPAAASAVGPGAYAVGLGLWAVTCATPQFRAPSAPREKPPSALFKSETDAKANEKVTLCNNFAQLSLQSQQRSAQARTSSPERQ